TGVYPAGGPNSPLVAVESCPRIVSVHRARSRVSHPTSQPRASAIRIASVTTADSNSPARALESACVTLIRSTAWISSGSGRRSDVHPDPTLPRAARELDLLLGDRGPAFAQGLG